MDLVATITEANVAHAHAVVCAQNSGVAQRSKSEGPAGNVIHMKPFYYNLVAMFIRLASILLAMLMTTQAASRILVHGHRGARARYPENTIPAFDYAIGIGVDVLEMDVAVTKDNVLVISHDPHLNPADLPGPGSECADHDPDVGGGARSTIAGRSGIRVSPRSSLCRARGSPRSMRC